MSLKKMCFSPGFIKNPEMDYLLTRRGHLSGLMSTS